MSGRRMLAMICKTACTKEIRSALRHLQAEFVISILSMDGEVNGSAGGMTLATDETQEHPMESCDTEEWFCLACGRTSDHTNEPDARSSWNSTNA